MKLHHLLSPFLRFAMWLGGRLAKGIILKAPKGDGDG